MRVMCLERCRSLHTVAGVSGDTPKGPAEFRECSAGNGGKPPKSAEHRRVLRPPSACRYGPETLKRVPMRFADTFSGSQFPCAQVVAFLDQYKSRIEILQCGRSIIGAEIHVPACGVAERLIGVQRVSVVGSRILDRTPRPPDRLCPLYPALRRADRHWGAAHPLSPPPRRPAALRSEPRPLVRRMARHPWRRASGRRLSAPPCLSSAGSEPAGVCPRLRVGRPYDPVAPSSRPPATMLPILCHDE